MHPSAVGPVDARGDRLAQALVGVLLLAAYVFGQPWLVLVIAVITLADAVGGPRADLFVVLYVRLVAPRLGPADAEVLPETMRAQNALICGLCIAALLLFVLGATPLGWLLAIVAAIVAVIAATTSVHLGEVVLHRFRH